jgi:phage terminase large subunit GpA-like protein
VNARAPTHLFIDDAAAVAALDSVFDRVWAEMAPPPHMTPLEWAETYRVMGEEETANPGHYSMENTPALRGILVETGNPDVRKIAVQKSAQVGYTAGIVCNVIGYHIHWRPSVQIVMFPREKSSKDFAAEKFEPMVRATPVLAERVNLKSRAAGNGTTRRSFRGGLLKFVASNSPSDVKSSSGRVGIVEEPDDTNVNVAGQGNAITMLAERTKTYAPDDLQLIGGTPTAKATSLIVKEMRSTDQRHFMVPCHSCGEAHALEWDNVTIPGLNLSAEDLELPAHELDAKWPQREVYGRARWEAAYYTCPHCGSLWTDDERIANIKRAASVAPHYGWVRTAESATPGFYLTELLSTFEGSRLPVLAMKYLVAKSEMDHGDPEKMITFWNSSLGLPWEYRGELPEEDELRDRAEAYAEWSCPAGGLVPCMTVDVQHDRLAVTVWVAGRGEEAWLAYWGELPGRTIIAGQGAWCDLEELMDRTVTHASGAHIAIAAVAIDSGDGQTSDAVYAFVRKHDKRQRPVCAVKGASDRVGKVEIWSAPRAVDPNRKSSKADRAGVQVSIVGTARAKDMILGATKEGGRVRLEGSGPGRMHWYKGVREDFFEQLLGEMKIPGLFNKRIREWTERTDRRNEALDCTVYFLWLCRRLRLHTFKPTQWEAIEFKLRQASLLALDELVPPEEAPAAAQPAATSAPAPAPAPDADAGKDVDQQPPGPAAPAAPKPASPKPVPVQSVGGGGRVTLSKFSRFNGGR